MIIRLACAQDHSEFVKALEENVLAWAPLAQQTVKGVQALTDSELEALIKELDKVKELKAPGINAAAEKCEIPAVHGNKTKKLAYMVKLAHGLPAVE